MPTYRIEKTKNYTVMSNHHLKDKRMSLKAKGLLCQFLSLPDHWNFSTRGIASINKEGVDSIGSALKELEKCGYLIRTKLRDDKGRITDTEYAIYEYPQASAPNPSPPHTENPDMGEPNPILLAQLNTNRTKTKGLNTNQSINPHFSATREDFGGHVIDTMDSRTQYRKLIEDNIEYPHLCEIHALQRDIIDEIVGLMVETVCSTKQKERIGGGYKPIDVVRGQLLGLNSEHISYVLESFNQNTTKVRNIRSYLLTSLYNAPTSIGSYYRASVNHDMYGA